MFHTWWQKVGVFLGFLHPHRSQACACIPTICFTWPRAKLIGNLISSREFWSLSWIRLDPHKLTPQKINEHHRNGITNKWTLAPCICVPFVLYMEWRQFTCMGWLITKRLMSEQLQLALHGLCLWLLLLGVCVRRYIYIYTLLVSWVAA